MELENYKAIVFDLGGTLMEYEGMPLDWSDYYYDKSYGDLVKKMGMEKVAEELC